jgi:hypothetical protein
MNPQLLQEVGDLQRFAGSWGTAIFKSLVQREVDDLKCPSYACEPLYLTFAALQ